MRKSDSHLAGFCIFINIDSNYQYKRKIGSKYFLIMFKAKAKQQALTMFALLKAFSFF